MIFVPVGKVESEARRDGLRTPLLLVQEKSISNGYNPFTRKIRLKPYNNRRRCAMRLAHELKHQIDLQYWPGWLVFIVYWPAILSAGLWVGYTLGWGWLLPAGVGAYFLHPFEISANIYALRRWKTYEKILSNSSE